MFERTRRIVLRGGLAVVLLWLGSAGTAMGASRKELTWLPCGAKRLPPGKFSIDFNLPRDYAGVIPNPILLLGFYEKDKAITPESQPTGAPPENHAYVKINVGAKRLPDWDVTATASGYVVNLQTIRQNPKFADGKIVIDFEVAMYPPGMVWLYVLGVPDPLLMGDALDGPLALFAEKATDADIKTYFEGLIAQLGTAFEEAGKKFSQVKHSKNERVGMFARRGLRLLKLPKRSKKQNNFADRYKWGVYLETCGFFFPPALDEFNACLRLDDDSSPSWYRQSEMLEMCGFPMGTIANGCERAGRETRVTDPTVWSVLVTILRERKLETVKDGKPAIEKWNISDTDIARIKDEWINLEGLIFGSSRGTFKLNTAFYQIEDEAKRPFVKDCNTIVGPADGIVEVRGWFDSVVSIRPHAVGEPDTTVGGDCGPNGAALSDVGADADWQRFFEQFYRQLSWALMVGEYGPGAPRLDDAIGCGVGPIPSVGYGMRSAMRYYMTPLIFRYAKIVPTVRPLSSQTVTTQPTSSTAAEDEFDDEAILSYLRYWRVFGPYLVEDQWPASGLPSKRHTLDALPTLDAQKGIIVDSAADFIDLKALLKPTGWSLAKAVCWVKSSESQRVQMWIGQNDAVAVWLNGRCVHRGDYASSGKYEDRNLVDTVPSFAMLQKGWNRFEVVTEGWPAPLNKGWGFSIRLTRFNGAPVVGLRVTTSQPSEELATEYVAPETGYYYAWTRCEDAYHDLMPRLTEADLMKLTGLRGLKVIGKVGGADGMVALTIDGRKDGSGYRTPPTAWNGATDRDVTLNNVMDWEREDTLAIHFERDGQPHDLLVLKPEATEAYLTLLKEPKEAKGIFGQLAPGGRVIGYLPVAAEGGSSRTLIVADVLLAEEGQPWPVDEEDMMDPLQQ